MLYTGPIADSHVHAFTPKEDMYRVFDTMVSFGATDAILHGITYLDANMRGFALDKEAQKRILHDNFIDFVCPNPKKINTALLKEHAEYLRRIAEKRGDAEIISAIDSALGYL